METFTHKDLYINMYFKDEEKWKLCTTHFLLQERDD